MRATELTTEQQVRLVKSCEPLRERAQNIFWDFETYYLREQLNCFKSLRYELSLCSPSWFDFSQLDYYHLTEGVRELNACFGAPTELLEALKMAESTRHTNLCGFYLDKLRNKCEDYFFAEWRSLENEYYNLDSSESDYIENNVLININLDDIEIDEDGNVYETETRNLGSITL